MARASAEAILIVGHRGVPAALYDSTFSLQKDVLYYKTREYAAACRANKMEETAMEASKVYYTDFRCPVGTSLLDKLRRVCIAAGIKAGQLGPDDEERLLSCFFCGERQVPS